MLTNIQRNQNLLLLPKDYRLEIRQIDGISKDTCNGCCD